jgi:hypothetical protein
MSNFREEGETMSKEMKEFEKVERRGFKWNYPDPRVYQIVLASDYDALLALTKDLACELEIALRPYPASEKEESKNAK